MNGLAGKNVVIASGPTLAPIDTVRSITNHSSGRLGAEIGYRLHKAGADIVFLAGESSETPKTLFLDNTLEPVTIEYFRTVPDLKKLLQNYLTQRKIDAVVMAAAVLDYLPENVSENKHSSHYDEWTITLKRGEKLIERILNWSPSTTIVGFKLESGITETELKERAVDLLRRSGAKFVVGNLTERIDTHSHHAYIYERLSQDQKVTISDLYKTKQQIAEALVQRLHHYFEYQKGT